MQQNNLLQFIIFDKVFEVMEDSVGVICPKYNLEPPHYDGIQSLCLMGDLLFSGSRDTCIKKWDLAEQQLKQVESNKYPTNLFIFHQHLSLEQC